jgi:hypothetical protein
MHQYEVRESVRRRISRLAPAQELADYELQVILICQEGYASSLAAASLQDLGLHRATDVIGGYEPGVNCCKSFRTPVRRNAPSGRTRMGHFDGRAAKRAGFGQIPA